MVNRMPVLSHGRPIGSVTTLRDRTEMLELHRELDLTRHVTDTLRAQAHEFSNRMHTIAGLIELGEYDEAAATCPGSQRHPVRVHRGVTSHVDDPSVAALLIAKSSQADRARRRPRPRPRRPSCRARRRLSADVNTVVGNLVDNALDACGRAPGPVVAVEVVEDAARCGHRARLRARGAAGHGERVFPTGFTHEGTAAPGDERGIGLALVRLICRKRGGDVTVRHDGGAVFIATLPVNDQRGCRR